MADNILKLRVESSEYDQKLKKAAEGIRHLAEVAHKGGGELTGLEKAELDYVKALGSMETKSRTAAGGVRELESTFKELTVVYNNLNDVEKQDEGGKALRASLDQIKQRAQEARKELESASKALGDVEVKPKGGFFDGLGSKMEGALAVFGGNLMTKAAGAVAQLGSEMVGLVQQGIEMARQGEGIRIAFERLGRGDILDGLREATHGTVTDLELMKAAVMFNDFKLPVEELGTMLAFAQQKAKDTGQSVDYMVSSIVTGLGRKSLMILDNLGLSATEIKERMKETGDMTKAVGAIIRDQMAKAGDYVETAADRATKADVELKNAMEELGRTFQPLADAGTSMWTTLETGALKFLTKIGAVIAQMTEAGRIAAQYGDMGGSDRVGSQLSAYQNAKDKNSYRKAVLASYDAQIRQREKVLAGIDAWRSGDRSAASRAAFDKMEQYGVGRGDNAALRAQINALRKQRDEFARGAVESTVSPITNPNGPKKETKKELTELQQNQQKINELTQEYVKLGDESTEAARKRQAEIQKEIKLLEQRNGLLGLRAEQAQGRLLPQTIDLNTNGVAKGSGLFGKETQSALSKPAQLSDKAMKAVEKNIQKQTDLQVKERKDQEKQKTTVAEGLGDLAGGMNSVVGGLKQLGIDIPEGIQQAIGVVQGISTILTGIATTLLAIEALTTADVLLPFPFANGGIVPKAAGGMLIPGNSFSGDNLRMPVDGGRGWIGVNSGELILNHVQQNNLANALTGGGMQNLNLSASISGEQIRLVLNNNGRRTGRGEYVQTNFR